MSDPLLIARREADFSLLPQMGNRHGLIAGATGTGKNVTLQKMAEEYSRIGVPVFMADVKGDLAGLSQPGGDHPKVLERIAQLAVEGFEPAASPVVFWDVFGEHGHPIRTTVSEMGPLLLGRLLNLNDTQLGVLHLVFKVADESGLLLLDLKDLRALLVHVSDHASELRVRYGNVSPASVGAIQRRLLALEEEGGARLFGEPAINLDDFMQTDAKGRGVINILAADRLMQSPTVYATLLLWLLSELFEELPEVGDLEKPKLVFFFDEAHLLFDDIPKALENKIEQVVRLIRSKAVGVYFVTQNPRDVPDDVLGQLGNRVQHALRAFTPSDQKAVRAAAQTFRQNPKFDTEAALTQLGVGEALVSFLDAKGQPGVVDRALVIPPRSRLGAISESERAKILRDSPVAGHYEKEIDRESAYEKLTAAAAASTPPSQDQSTDQKDEPVSFGGVFGSIFGSKTSSRGRRSDSVATAMTKSVMRSVGSSLGRQIARGIMGAILGGTASRRR